MISKRKAFLYASIITLTVPEVAKAQYYPDAATSPGDVSFSSSTLPLQNNYPPLNDAVNLGKDIYASNSTPADSPSYTSGGLLEVNDIYQEAKQNKPNFLKDVFLGPDDSGQRALHPTTAKVFNILGKAQKGLETYKAAKGIYNAIGGKNSSGIVSNVRNILLLYGVIDPNSAVASAAAVDTAQTIATIASAADRKAKLQKAAFKDPKTPRQWYIKGLNNDAISSMAAQTGPDIVLSPDGQQRLQAEEEISAASAEALQVVISDAANSAIKTRQLEEVAQTQAATSAEVAQGAQKRKSTQQAVKDLNTLAGIQANLDAIQASTLAEINGNTLRNLGGMASIVGMQRVQLDKATTMQLMTALNGRQLANINSGVHRAHNYQVQKDLQARRQNQRSMQNFIIPVPSEEPAPTTTAEAAQ